MYHELEHFDGPEARRELGRRDFYARWDENSQPYCSDGGKNSTEENAESLDSSLGQPKLLFT